MKIILSPSKTMKPSRSKYLIDKDIILPQEHNKIFSTLSKMSKNELSNALSIKGAILENTYNNIKNFSDLDHSQAFESYTGLVFFNIDRSRYAKKEYDYIMKHLRILDAFYGILEPGTLIKPYRLDMKAKLGFNLYKFWDITRELEDNVIVNLASNEFSKMVQKPMINIHFKQYKNNKYINQATYSKQARGLFFDYLVKNKITKVDEMRTFNLDNYTFNPDLSNEFNITFTR